MVFIDTLRVNIVVRSAENFTNRRRRWSRTLFNSMDLVWSLRVRFVGNASRTRLKDALIWQHTVKNDHSNVANALKASSRLLFCLLTWSVTLVSENSSVKLAVMHLDSQRT